ncbi:MAG: hypothetical protein Q9182_006064 [Xanthomendoza sp. 2 TL-2023]
MAVGPVAPNLRFEQHPNVSDDPQQFAATTKPARRTDISYLVNPDNETPFSDLPFRNIRTHPSVSPSRCLYEPSPRASTHHPYQLDTEENSYPCHPPSQQSVPHTPFIYLPTPSPAPSPLNPDPSTQSPTRRAASVSAFPSANTDQPPVPSKPRRASTPGHHHRNDKEAKIDRKKKKKEWKRRMELDWETLAAEQKALFSAHGTPKRATPMEEERPIKLEKAIKLEKESG